jgi:phage shock protein PspC (stress-responsive transcriptional regulator)
MKGKILDFSIAENQGLISGDDGSRYMFAGREWKSQSPPKPGSRVDFDVDGRTAVAVYVDHPSRSAWDSEYWGFYRSSDDKVLGGVCAGLAHKWGINRGALRFGWFLAALFTWIPFFVYIGCWMSFPERPTRNP